MENLGRITYGPEILDNSKGLFGSAHLGGGEISGWKITPLEVRDADPEGLAFEPLGACGEPCFRRGHFDCAAEGDVYLDVSGWGMGEVWINGRYLGLVLGRGETAVDPDSRGRPHAEGKPVSWFSTSRTTTPPRQCASRTNPCSNNKQNR